MWVRGTCENPEMRQKSELVLSKLGFNLSRVSLEVLLGR